MIHAPLNTRTTALQLLLAGSGFGLELIERAKHATAGRIKLQQGALYPVLRHLEEGGFVSSNTEHGKNGGRPRVYYKLTARGRKRALLERKLIASFFNIKHKKAD